MEWQQYSNTKELVNGRIALNSGRIADGELALVEERSKTKPDEKLIDNCYSSSDFCFDEDLFPPINKFFDCIFRVIINP